MNKIVEYLKNNEKATKMISSVVLFIIGLGLIFLGIVICNINFGFCAVLTILGIISGVLGAVPLVCFWVDWQGID